MAPQTITDALAVLRIASHPSSVLPYCNVHAKGSSAEALFEAMLRAAAVLSDVPVCLVQNCPHPDASLHAAWDRFVTAWRVYSALPSDLSDEESETEWTAYQQAHVAVDQMMPSTAAGVAIRLKVALIAMAQSRQVTPETAFIGPPPSELTDTDHQLLWRLIEHLEGATVAAGPFVTPTAPESDAFAETIVAFQKEAPSSLAIPDTPTEAMLKAGAAAGGCSTETVRAAFAAMVDAYRREAA